MGAPGARTVAERSWRLENKQLRKELAQMRIERDIVKAATYFAKGSLKVRAHEGMAKRQYPLDSHGQVATSGHSQKKLLTFTNSTAGVPVLVKNHGEINRRQHHKQIKNAI